MGKSDSGVLEAFSHDASSNKNVAHSFNIGRTLFNSSTVQSRPIELTMDKEKGIRRPVNAFMLWAKTERKKLAKALATDDNPALSKILGKRWREMSKDIKRQYMIQAEVLRQEHLRLYPDFKYGKKPTVVKHNTIQVAPSVHQQKSKLVRQGHCGHTAGLPNMAQVSSCRLMAAPKQPSQMYNPHEQIPHYEPISPALPQTMQTPFDSADILVEYTPNADLLSIDKKEFDKYLDGWLTQAPTPRYEAGNAFEPDQTSRWNTIQAINAQTVDVVMDLAEPSDGGLLSPLLYCTL